MSTLKTHWENIYSTKDSAELSWYQEAPQQSIQCILDAQLSNSAAIIDIGAGSSSLVDNLLSLNFTNLFVLDVSGVALQKAQNRLAEKAKLVQWIESDVLAFAPNQSFDLWHDRAVFHFLTNEDDQKKYRQLLTASLSENGNFIVGTFAINGPPKCSGLPVQRYSKESLEDFFSRDFVLKNSFEYAHFTPSGFQQNFIFCHFQKK